MEWNTVTDKIEVDLAIGRYRKEEKGKDGMWIKKIQDNYNLEENETEIIYTDGSKSKESIATGASQVIW